ncbi:threonine dehydrogenase-like Zn-dependent dehydrogenase [Pontibacter ummariensis]|uniref:Threonine dehydrogenase n=1 Tax=Pontibacter ummariensis TaxID=1610492 RepID=A0A239JQW7_9BACT|nr:zinc-dependent alcohol dehydrogenase [Pontibacter ummariensis]PRY07375.1 threonine dehydrogenase-like Zn-dependent dehydrogenase [Pontibacter ummariensis]SNT07932.1 Threonine dehydrogenase [Pontibacter ummariensis]
MKALCWNGVNDLRVERVPDPSILNPKDAIVRVTMSSVCGSDLHLLDGYVPTMKAGDIIGHEFIGEVVETGSGVKKFKKGDRVVVCSIIGCGGCAHCLDNDWSLCDNSNTKPEYLDKAFGYATAGIFGYSHAFGGYAGSHAEYIRVPFADQGAFKVPEGLPDESLVFVSDAFPTGFMAADMCGIEPGDTVAVWGCGGVGQMAIRSAYLLGAGRVIAIDRFEDRLQTAKEQGKAEVLNYEKVDVLEALKEMTGGRGPDRCIDAVGLEAHTTGVEEYYDKVKQTLRIETGRPAVLRQAIMACRKGGTLSIVGVYGGLLDKFPMGPAMNKALTFRMGQQHGQRYIPELLDIVAQGKVDPSYILTHKWTLDQGPEGYQMFKKKTDNCMRVVFTP